jgi:hypothetical protein
LVPIADQDDRGREDGETKGAATSASTREATNCRRGFPLDRWRKRETKSAEASRANILLWIGFEAFVTVFATNWPVPGNLFFGGVIEGIAAARAAFMPSKGEYRTKAPAPTSADE